MIAKGMGVAVIVGHFFDLGSGTEEQAERADGGTQARYPSFAECPSSRPTGLLHDHRDGVGFIEKAKTPVRLSLPPISGINVNTTSNKIPEGVRDKRADPGCP